MPSKNDTLDDWDDFDDMDLPLMLTCDKDDWIEMSFVPKSITKAETDQGWGILTYDGTFDGAPVEDEEICFWAKKAFVAMLKDGEISRKGKKSVDVLFRKTKDKKDLNQAEFKLGE